MPVTVGDCNQLAESGQPIKKTIINHNNKRTMYINLGFDTDDVKHFFQKLFRGYSDEDLYCFEDLFVKKMRKPFKEFLKRYEKDSTKCCPANLWGKGTKKETSHAEGLQEWEKILNKIDLAFDIHAKEKMVEDGKMPDEHWLEDKIEDNKNYYGGRYRKLLKAKKEGFELFGKYIGDLWS